MRPRHSVRPNIRLTGTGTDLITILRCVLSFKTVVTSRIIIVFKIKISRPTNGHPSRARSLVPRAASWYEQIWNTYKHIQTQHMTWIQADIAVCTCVYMLVCVYICWCLLVFNEKIFFSKKWHISTYNSACICLYDVYMSYVCVFRMSFYVLACMYLYLYVCVCIHLYGHVSACITLTQHPSHVHNLNSSANCSVCKSWVSWVNNYLRRIYAHML